MSESIVYDEIEISLRDFGKEDTQKYYYIIGQSPKQKEHL
jgi:hypothetical protein